MSLGVCDLRLDFEAFTLVGTGNTAEVVTENPAATAGGQCSADSFTISVTPLIPVAFLGL